MWAVVVAVAMAAAVTMAGAMATSGDRRTPGVGHGGAVPAIRQRPRVPNSLDFFFHSF